MNGVPIPFFLRSRVIVIPGSDDFVALGCLYDEEVVNGFAVEAYYGCWLCDIDAVVPDGRGWYGSDIVVVTSFGCEKVAICCSCGEGSERSALR